MWSAGRSRCLGFVAGFGAAVAVLCGSPAAGLAQDSARDALPVGAKLIEADTTANSDTYALPNGHLLTRVYLYPVNGLDAQGKWQPLSEAAYARDAASAESVEQSPSAGEVSPDAERPLGQEDETSCSITSSAPTTSACNEKTFKVGYESAGETKRRGLIFFVLPERHEEEVILNAKLELYAGSTTTTNTGAMGVYRATKQWTSAATWDKRTSEASWVTPGGDFATGGVNDWIDSSVGASKGWVYWYPTRLVQEWYAGSDAPAGQWQSDLGFLIKYATEGSTNNVVSFDGREEREYDPQLSIESAQRGIGDNSRYTNLTTPISSSQSLSVNPASGDLMIHSTDFTIPDDGFEFLSARNWNSLASEAPGYGYGWVDTNAVYIEPFKGSGAIAYTDGTGATFAFVKEGASFITPPGIEATMCAAGSAAPCPEQLPTGTVYQLIYTRSGERINFKGKEPEDFPIDVLNAAGQTMTASYGSEIEQPISWTDAEATKIAYSATYEKGYTKITNKGTEQSALYTETKGADLIDHLTKYTSMSGEATAYAYGSEYLEGNELQKITEPSGEVIKLTYDEHERIAKIERLANAEATSGTSTTYTYYAFGQAPAPCTAKQKGTLVTGPAIEEEEEAPQQTLYCANALDEVEGGTNLTAATGQPGWYALIEEEDGGSAFAAVNVAGGNLFVENEDLIPSEASEEIGLDRYYNSLAPSSQSKGLGPRWIWGVGPDVYLAISGETAVLHGPNGYVVALHQSGSSYLAPEEFEGALTKNENGTYTLSETEEGATYQFNASGAMTSYSNEEGESFTVADTTLSGKSLLHTITPSGGKALEVKYDSTPHVVEVKSPNGNIRKYAYNSQGQLASFTNPSGETTEYEYTNGYLSKITTPNGTVETITSEGGRVSEVSISEPGEETYGYKFTYQPPTAPTCEPATDSGETTVTETSVEEGSEPEIYCYDALGQITRYPPTVGGEEPEEEDEEEEGAVEEQKEGTETACSEEPGVTAEECAPYGDETESGLTPLDASSEQLSPEDFGISEGNKLSGYDAFQTTTFNKLHVQYLRLLVPWNLVYEYKVTKNTAYTVEYDELLQKLEQFGKDSEGGIVLLSIEHCEKPDTQVEAEVQQEEREGKTVERNSYWYPPGSGKTGDPRSCDELPTPVQYHEELKELVVDEAAMNHVKYFTAWNEPNNTFTKATQKEEEERKAKHEFKKPETGKPPAKTAGEYWRELNHICKAHQPHCKGVVAGDFSDYHMQDAANAKNEGGVYLEHYYNAMGQPGQAPAWAFHTYLEDKQTVNKYAHKPKEWWKALHSFVSALHNLTKGAPKIWLTEQGVNYPSADTVKKEEREEKAFNPKARSEMDAYVHHGQSALIAQSDQIKLFFYYEMRGALDGFDTGLIKPETREAARPIYGIYKRKTAP